MHFSISAANQLISHLLQKETFKSMRKGFMTMNLKNTMKLKKNSEQHIRMSSIKQKHLSSLETTISLATFSNLPCLISSNHWRACSTGPWRKGRSLLFGKLLELILFSKKEIKMPKRIIGQYLSFQSFQEPL